jgi:hypothetical protein
VGGEDSIVRLNDGSRHARSRVDSKLKFRLLSVVSRETLQQQSTKARSSTTAKRVEDQESLEGGAVICRRVKTVETISTDVTFHTSNAADTVNDAVNELLSDSVVTTSV